MEHIRQWHLQRGFGDIGYHYAIDRNGRLWEGRNIRFQGAHVRKHNEQNLGIMVLGNFDKQQPSPAQIHAVNSLLPRLARTYGVRRHRIYTHQELMPTTCPGNALQNHMVRFRRSGALG